AEDGIRCRNVTGVQSCALAILQVGSIMIENKTGRILSFVGGRDYDLENLNHAPQAYRQNGSSMKPLLVYGPAIEYGVIGAGSPSSEERRVGRGGGARGGRERRR